MTATTPARAPSPAASRRCQTTLALLLAGAVLGGCAQRHHVEVGAIPDDYRTRHPIVVADAEEAMELPVVSSETRLTNSDRSRVRQFASRFRASGAATIRMFLPAGSVNAAAAELVSSDVVKTLEAAGVPHGRLIVQPYHAAGLGGSAPIRLSYLTLAAKTAPCGRWPEDLGETTENRNYFNFGCASQQNLAAQIADPRDLLGPRGMGEIDAARRTEMLERYRQGQLTGSEQPSSEQTYDW